MPPFIDKIKKNYYNIYVIENKEKKNYESDARFS
jgi:hypothetical protein